jgi:hypothetical protein
MYATMLRARALDPAGEQIQTGQIQLRRIAGPLDDDCHRGAAAQPLPDEDPALLVGPDHVEIFEVTA